MNLVLIETSGNQQYIFATNKLKENVGASELTYHVGTKLVLEAVAKTANRESLYDKDDAKLRANLLDVTKNGPLEKDPARKVEVVIATSGKALLLVGDEETAKRIIRYVTRQTLDDAPGLTVHGAISGWLDNDLSGLNAAVQHVHEKLERNRYRTPSQEQRFLRLPFGEPCATSGLPASEYKTTRNKEVAYSAVTLAKWKNANGGWDRIAQTAKRVAPLVRLLKSVDALEEKFEELKWISVIHADGNGLGEIFLKFGQYAKCNGREYLNKYRRFSLALDVCTIRAFGYALEELKRRFDSSNADEKERHKDELPIVPLVLGGDDLTLICDGQYAVRFTRDFLTRFEEETATVDQEHSDGIVREIAQEAFAVGSLAICAGIAIIKPHFPFHAAYELAEALLKSAKQVKNKVTHMPNGKESPVSLPCSALDYHVLYDSSGADLERIREKLKVDESTHLYARPYLVTSVPCIQNALDQNWIGRRTWTQLEDRVLAMSAKEEDDDRRALPNSMLHDLREGLFLGCKEADARMRLVQQRYEDKGFNKLLVKKNGAYSLFWEWKDEENKDKTIHETNYLDALDLVEFWK